jgi:putative radical SAM enzyme (TIGR03279 family)
MFPTILEVVPGSPADRSGLAPGDELISINGITPTDVIEYQQLVDEADPSLVIGREGVRHDVMVGKRAAAPLGIRLNASIFDRVQTCDNHCEFCFIYQLPPGLRKSLYLKDDDYRLSFLYGNFTTLTRFTELDLARVAEERLGPLYVSIHATDPDVRIRMLRNPRGATSLRWLRGLLERDVVVHGQIVLCPGINDGAVLARTCAEVLVRYPQLASVGIVPLGLSRFNKEEALRPHDLTEARRDLAIIHEWQDIALRRLGRRMFFASDELYLMADMPFPGTIAYEDYAQHENGIGMVRAFYDEVERLERGVGVDPPIITGEWRSIPAAPATGYRAPRHTGSDPATPASGPAVIVTGEYGGRVFTPVLDRISRLAGRELRVLPVRNDFFQGNVAVSGLIVGQDVSRTLRADTAPAALYLLPDVALVGDRFLDDVALDEVAAVAKAPVKAVPATAGGLLEGLAA